MSDTFNFRFADLLAVAEPMGEPVPAAGGSVWVYTPVRDVAARGRISEDTAGLEDDPMAAASADPVLMVISEMDFM